MYRWAAIRGDPLAAYFKIEETALRDLTASLANMYLAEVRESRGRGGAAHCAASWSGSVSEFEAEAALMHVVYASPPLPPHRAGPHPLL